MSLVLLSQTRRSASHAVVVEKDSPCEVQAAVVVELEPRIHGVGVSRTDRHYPSANRGHDRANRAAVVLSYEKHGAAATPTAAVAVRPRRVTATLVELFAPLATLPAAWGSPRARYLAAKRVTDVVGSMLCIVCLLPIMAVAALLIKTTTRGPFLYAHTRVGKRGRRFTCYKFRTMVIDADQIQATYDCQNSHSDSRTFKIPNDPRVTAVGRWLRKLSIDELPQLWNVLRGDMSLVGPRPPVPREVMLYKRGDLRRLLAKPGLTCTWQVSGRSRVPFPEQLEMDLAYIRDCSLWLDLKLIARTIPAVLSADGAY